MQRRSSSLICSERNCVARSCGARPVDFPQSSTTHVEVASPRICPRVEVKSLDRERIESKIPIVTGFVQAKCTRMECLDSLDQCFQMRGQARVFLSRSSGKVRNFLIEMNTK